jgi:hypothetical protein
MGCQGKRFAGRMSGGAAGKFKLRRPSGIPHLGSARRTSPTACLPAVLSRETYPFPAIKEEFDPKVAK